MPIGDPVAVTLVEKDVYQSLKDASSTGGYVLPDQQITAVNQCFRTLGLNGKIGDFWLALMIVNGLPEPLTLSDSWLDDCTQTHYPAEFGFLGGWADAGGSVHKNQGGDTLKPDIIPGTRPHYFRPGVTLYGAGAYGFQVNNAANHGAIAFKYSDNAPALGVSWYLDQMNFPTLTGSNCAVTVDISAYIDLKTFYNQTAGAKTVGYDDNSDVSIRATLNRYDVIDYLKDGKPWYQCYALTVAVWPK